MRWLVLLIIALAAAVPARAQSLAARAHDQGYRLPTVEGERMTCHDFRNRAITFVSVPDLGDAGRAEFVWGTGPVVMTDPAVLGTLPVGLQVFFKLHECGHHALGHLLGPTARSEREADCWAIEQGHVLAVIDRIGIESWRPYFSASLGDRNGHLPGPARIDFLLSCYDDGAATMAKLD